MTLLRPFTLPVGLACLLCCGSLLCGTASRATAATTNAPAPAAPIKSVFDDKLPGGKDPFFPTSSRRVEKTASGKDEVPSPPPLTVSLSLRGFSGTALNRLAIINDHTFAAGEEREVATPSGRMVIRCVEIRENSVIVSVGSSGQRVELKLPTAP
ncbi:MAG TPA: hypothetical protein VL527_02250 [Dongiaceae bacterium]|nr:hypothetical protein [Dongiaceae bacterium]